MQRLGERIDPNRTYQRRPGAYAIIRQGRDALLTASIEGPEPELQLAGGGIDPGESPLHALHREVLEETGWRIQVERRLGVYQRFTYMPEYDLWAQKVCTIYLARPVREIGPPTEPHHVPVWCKTAGLHRLLVDPSQARFTEQCAGLI